jgi:hypothetical protein
VALKMLDLFCGVGGAAVGYARAGMTVFGVDNARQTDYPFNYKRQDALTYLWEHGTKYDIIHASPPCQQYSTLANAREQQCWVDMLPEVRKMLDLIGRPYIIENVVGAPMRQDLMLCGTMFGLKVFRHRIFEIRGFHVPRIFHRDHDGKLGKHGPYWAVYGNGGSRGTIDEWQAAMGIDWTWQRKSLAQAIPPAYTEYIGKYAWNELAK